MEQKIVIDSESVDAQHNEKTSQYQKGENKENGSSVGYDELKKHYFTDFLGADEQEAMRTIRFLPWSATDGSIFKKFKAHVIRAKTKDGTKKWQTFMCPKNEDPKAPCPFCELAAKAGEKMRAATDPVEQKNYKEIFASNVAKDHFIARVVDRDDVESGVKFWRFKDTPQGPFEQIYSLKQIKAKMGVDIFNPYNGKDIIINIKRNKDKKKVISISDYEDKTPIFPSEEEMLKWVNDTTDYKKLFPTKSYDFLSVYAEGGYPFFDKQLGKYVNKEEWEKAMNEAKNAELQENLNQDVDYSSYEVNTGRTTNVTRDVPFSSVMPNGGDSELPY